MSIYFISRDFEIFPLLFIEIGFLTKNVYSEKMPEKINITY